MHTLVFILTKICNSFACEYYTKYGHATYSYCQHCTADIIMLCYMQTVAKKVGLSDSNKYFALFLRTEYDFGKIKHCTVQYVV